MLSNNYYVAHNSKTPGVSGVLLKGQERTGKEISSDKLQHERNISSGCSVDGY